MYQLIEVNFMQKQKYVYLLLAAIAFFTAANSYADHCVRHIYNNSTAPWIFKFATQHGNVTFPGTSCQQNGPCAIPPQSTVEIDYSTTGGQINGLVSITDYTYDTNSFSYDNSTINDGLCPYVQHSGDTGSVAVNDPANGDFNAWGPNSWNGSASNKK